MPPKVWKSKSKKAIKKRNYKRKKNVVFKNNISMGLGFPRKLTTTLKYKDYVFFTSTSGVMQNYHFSANGIWKPNLTGSSHQPMFMDQYMQLYNHFHVIGSKIKVTFLSFPTNLPAACGIYINDDTTVLSTNYTAMSEQTQSKMRVIGSSGADEREVVSYKYSAKKMFGGSVLSNNALRGSATANPNEVATYNIYYQALDMTSTTQAYGWVEIEYLVVFTELKDFAQS